MSQKPNDYEPTPRTTLRRHRERGSYDRTTVHAILDEALVAHVGAAGPDGPVVLPMAHVRIDEVLYLHGARANALLTSLVVGSPVCVTVTLLDGLVFARSAFHHSMNYRCVTVFGEAEVITDPDEVRRASLALVDHLAAGRGESVRVPSDAELRRTLFVRIPLDACSAKVRHGGPADEPTDLDQPVWAGELPLSLVAGPPIPDAGVTADWPHHERFSG